MKTSSKKRSITRTPWRVALIGLGRMAHRYDEDVRREGIVTHAAAYQADDRFQMVAGVDPDAKQRELFQKRFPSIPVFDSIAAMKKGLGQRPEVASICSPASTHAAVLMQVVKSLPDLKAVFCEKPLTSDLAQARRLAIFWKKNFQRRPSIPFLLNYSRRWDETLQKVIRDIRQARWGEMQLVHLYYTGSLLETASHSLDATMQILGSPKWVQAIPGSPRQEGFSAVLGYDAGVTVFLHHLDRNAYLLYEMDIYLTKGRLRMADSGFYWECWKTAPHKHFSDFKSLARTISPYGPGYQNVLPQALDDLDGLLHHRGTLRCSMDDGFAVMEIMDALQRSHQQDGKKIKLVPSKSQRSERKRHAA